MLLHQFQVFQKVHKNCQVWLSGTVTPSQVLPLPLLQSHHGTTLHHIHLPTFDATILITTLCIFFYFISPFLLLKSSLRSCYHTCYHCMGTTTMAYARGMTTQPHLWVCKPPCCHHILPLAPTPSVAMAQADVFAILGN